jgi:hypothetical protein
VSAGSFRKRRIAAHFDGTSSYIQIPKLVTADFSISLWVLTTDTGATGPWYAGKGLVDGEAGANANDFGTALNAGKFFLGIGHPVRDRSRLGAFGTSKPKELSGKGQCGLGRYRPQRRPSYSVLMFVRPQTLLNELHSLSSPRSSILCHCLF